MAYHYYLLFAAIILGLSGESKSETFLIPVEEIKECLQRGLLANQCFTIACVIKKCIKEGYELLYENSSYSLEGHHDVHRRMLCAVDKCVDGIMNRKDEGSKWMMFSGFTAPFQACLSAIRACEPNPRDEL